MSPSAFYSGRVVLACLIHSSGMPASRRDFLTTTAAAAGVLRNAVGEPKREPLDGFALARRHTIVRTLPTPNFFEGMLLGNGDVGVCVTVRPDALGLHLGKSDSWDIRVNEEHESKVLTFAELKQLWERASAEAKRQGKPDMLFLENNIPELKAYTETVAASYKKVWPRPWPCGIVWIHWDASRFGVERQSLDPSNGLFELTLRNGNDTVELYARVNSECGHVCAWSDEAAAFHSVAYFPYTESEAQLPEPSLNTQQSSFSAFQRFPATAPTAALPHPPPSEKDRSLALHAVLKGNWRTAQIAGHVECYPGSQPQQLRLDIALVTTRDHPDNRAEAERLASRLSQMSVTDIASASDGFWIDYWSRSAVELADKELERWWYHNQYWLGCCLRAGKIAPGLFGNWTSGKIGTAWHGDYHMNYNTQQVFWGVFSSNHVDQHLPYLDLVESLMPVSERYAREKFDLPGAYFPHSAYPTPSQAVAYPVPPWGYEICETPWVVQSLWWHYLYTQDRQVLERVYPPLKAAADFIAGYVQPDAAGVYHVKPTVSPENWGCTVDYRLNQDCIMDLALIDFLLESVVAASEILERDEGARRDWSRIRAKLVSYPTAHPPTGAVWLDVPNAPAGRIYNIPVTLAPVFPGERVGLSSPPDALQLARHTAETIRLEGGNDVVFQPLIRARLGMLDLARFKDEVRYSMLPNGIVNDRVRQSGGRYKDTTDFDFMMRMGVWTENLSLPVVLNECMLQSYSGVLRFFPNTTNFGPARFHKLRAAGAFLVSAAWDGKTVSEIEIHSEQGRTLRFVSPWKNARVRGAKVREVGDHLEIATERGVDYRIERA